MRAFPVLVKFLAANLKLKTLQQGHVKVTKRIIIVTTVSASMN